MSWNSPWLGRQNGSANFEQLRDRDILATDMQMALPPSALVTGGGDGIGRAICIALSARGVAVTVADLNLAAAEETAALCLGGGALAVRCDVADEATLTAAFDAHDARWADVAGEMLCICNAGVAEGRDWRLAAQVNLVGVIATTRLALARMRQPAPAQGSSYGGGGARGGVVLCVGSLGGLLPMADQPVYAATKAGVLHYVRSLAEMLALDGESDSIRVCALAPAGVATALVAEQTKQTRPERAAAQEALIRAKGGLLPATRIADAALRLVATRGCNGTVLRVFQDGVLRFLEPSSAQRYPWSPMPPVEGLAELPPARRPTSRL